jgi:hypothetical protein
MKTYIKSTWIFISLLLALTIYLVYLSKQEDKKNGIRSIISLVSEASPVYTKKTTFDSLGIQLIFATNLSKKSYLDYKEILWIPKTFHIYDNGYFVWEGNLMDVFLSQKNHNPNCAFLLIGSYTESYPCKLFQTRQVYVVWIKYQ